MKDIILLLSGWALGTLTSWLLSKKGSEELSSTEDRVQRALEEQVRQLTIQLSAYSKLVQYSYAQLNEAGISGASKDVALKAQAELHKTKDIIETIPEKVLEGVDLTFIKNTEACPVCGEPSIPSGISPDMGGVLVQHYFCPAHGRFPSNHIDDLIDY